MDFYAPFLIDNEKYDGEVTQESSGFLQLRVEFKRSNYQTD